MCLFKYVKAALFSVTLVFSYNVHAVMIDTTNDSFIDQDTGLEWMDFGINNNTSFNSVVSQLGTGGLYDTWRLPTALEVYEMWANAYLGLGVTTENPNAFGPGQLRVQENPTAGVLENVQAVLGGTGGIGERLGWFEGTEGLSYVAYFKNGGGGGASGAYLYDVRDFESVRDYTDEHWSTLLVAKPVVAVPAPSVLIIFALGLISLGLRRKYRA